MTYAFFAFLSGFLVLCWIHILELDSHVDRTVKFMEGVPINGL